MPQLQITPNLHIPLDRLNKTYREHTLVIDLRVCVWLILNTTSGRPSEIAMFMNSIASHLRCKGVIVVDDQKDENGDYWRMIECKKLGLKPYKGARKDKPENYEKIYNAFLNYIKSEGIDYFSNVGFEADDWGGLIYNHCENVILCTVDQDWYQLVSDKKGILFFNARNYMQISQLKDEAEIMIDMARKGLQFSCPQDIIHEKCMYGDAGDNLAPGTPRHLIDLISPMPAEYNTLPESEIERLKQTILKPAWRQNALKLRSAVFANAAGE